MTEEQGVSAELSLTFELPAGIEDEVSFPLDLDIFVIALALQSSRAKKFCT